MSERDNQCNYVALENYQCASTSLKKYITASKNNCKHLHLGAEKVIGICHLPQLGDMSSPRPKINVLNDLEAIIKGKGISI
jgi:hypothetical protein